MSSPSLGRHIHFIADKVILRQHGTANKCKSAAAAETQQAADYLFSSASTSFRNFISRKSQLSMAAVWGCPARE